MSDFIDKFFADDPKPKRSSSFVDKFFPGSPTTKDAETPEERFGPIPKNAPKGAYYNENGQVVVPELQAEMIVRNNPVTSRVQELVQGTPLVGEYADEIVGKFNPQAAENMNTISDAFETARPKEAAALNITGGIAMSAPYFAGKVGGKALDFVNRGRGLAAKGFRSGLVAAPLAAAEGAAMASGRAQDGERVRKGAEGAVVGAGSAVALGPAAVLFGEAASATYQRFKKMDVSKIADALGIPPSAARTLKAQIAAGNFQDGVARLTRLGDDAMIGDATPATRQALDNAMATGPGATEIARTPINERSARVGAKLRTVFDDVLGPESGVRAATKEIAGRTSKARQQAYDFAYSRPVPTTGPVASRISATLDKIVPEDMAAALKQAAREMQASGYDNKNILASIQSDGSVTFSKPLSVLELDYIARGLANFADENTDKVTGQMSRTASLAMKRAGELRDALRDGVPGYKRAIKLGGDNVREKNALLVGRKLLTENVTFEDVADTMKDAPDAVKDSIRKGLRQNISAVMDRAKTTLASMEDGSFDFETGMDSARQALMAVKTIMTEGNVRKLRIALGKDAQPLIDAVQETADAFALRSAVARNSATAIRTAGRESMQAEAAPGAFRRIAGEIGGFTDATREITRIAAGTDAKSLNAAVQKDGEAIAQALTQIRGADAVEAYRAVEAAMNGQPLSDQMARKINQLLAGSTVLLGNQTAQRQIGPR